MTTRRLHAILRRHKIDPKFWPEFRAMVELGLNAGKELLARMNNVANYRAARDEIALTRMTEPKHQFSPDDYEQPAGYDFDMPAESLNPEDSVLAASGGCAV